MTTPANHTASAERVKLVAAFRAASKHWDSTEQHSANALVERGQELSRAAHALIEHLERSETHKAPYCYSDCMAATESLQRELKQQATGDTAILDWLSDNLLAADFAWGDPATPVIVIEIPKTAGISGDLRRDVLAIMAKQGGAA